MGDGSQDPTGTNWVAVQVAGVKMVQTFHRIIHTNPAMHCIGGAGGHTRQALTPPATLSLVYITCYLTEPLKCDGHSCYVTLFQEEQRDRSVCLKQLQFLGFVFVFCFSGIFLTWG